MEQYLIYIIKVSVLIAVLSLIYKLLLSRLTFHKFNRAVILGILLLSFVAPAIRITLPEGIGRIVPTRIAYTDNIDNEDAVTVSAPMDVTSMTPQVTEVTTVSTAEELSLPAPERRHISWILILFVAYCLGAAYYIIRKIHSVRCIVRIIKDGEYRNRDRGCDIIESDLVRQPVNWMHCIVMPRSWLEMENKAVWQHESLHAHKWHSIDLLLTDILSAVQWFNPMMLLVRKELELVHEYEADRFVIDNGTAANDYKMMLVNTLAANRGYAMSSWLLQSNLKNRIDMMEKTESKQVSKLRSIAILLVSVVFMAFNQNIAAAVQYPEFEDGRVWIFSDGTAKVRTFDGVEASVKVDDIAGYLHKYRKFRTTRISLRYMDGVSSLEQVQPLAESLDRYGIRTAVAIDDYMLDHMTMPEYRRAHIIDLGDGQYRFEMNCEMQDNLRYAVTGSQLRTLSITGDLALMCRWIGMFDGHGVAVYPQSMTWSDIRKMSEAAWARGIDQVSAVYFDSSEAADISGLNLFYQMYRNQDGARTITLIPRNREIEAAPDEMAIDVVRRMNAAISTDWFDKGIRIRRPDIQYNQNRPWLNVTNVIRTDDETVLLFYSWQGNDLWLTSMTGFTMRAGGQEYGETGHYGLEGFDEQYFWSPESGYYYFAVCFPAIPDDVETVDLTDSENGGVCIRGLQVSNTQTAGKNPVTMLLYDRYELKTINIHKDVSDVVTATTADLTEDETVVYMEMQIMEPHSVKGHVGSDFTLTFSNGRELKPIRIEGIKTDVDFDRGGDHVTNFFQIVFPASEPMEWLQGRATLKGVICHEPVTLDITSGVRIGSPGSGVPDDEMLMKILGVSGEDLHKLESSSEATPTPAATPVNSVSAVAVDLGLSVKWASCNVGAASPEEYGGYFAWGESNDKDDYDWTTYPHCYGTSSTLTKYCNKSSSGYNGYTDSKTVLDPEDDMAHANWGGDWRTPTLAEWTELMDSENCTWTWTSRNDVYGYEVTGKKPGFTGNSIFLPAAWCMVNNTLNKNFAQGGTPVAIGYYWSSSLYEQNPSRAYFISFTSGDNIDSNYRHRYTGLSVRPVCR